MGKLLEATQGRRAAAYRFPGLKTILSAGQTDGIEQATRDMVNVQKRLGRCPIRALAAHQPRKPREIKAPEGQEQRYRTLLLQGLNPEADGELLQGIFAGTASEWGAISGTLCNLCAEAGVAAATRKNRLMAKSSRYWNYVQQGLAVLVTFEIPFGRQFDRLSEIEQE